MEDKTKKKLKTAGTVALAPLAVVWWLVKLPPRIVDWVLNHKLGTILIAGAILYSYNKIKNYNAHQERVSYERKRLEQRYLSGDYETTTPKTQPTKSARPVAPSIQEQSKKAIMDYSL
ncbi:MAG: hypothetical protein IJV07_02505 [Alphaproteobacteria bacterium]|nr:hypothetical protein [Alphaproteobacteria bacterium]